MESFKELDLSPEIMRAISDMGFKKPSPIQAKAIPMLLEGSRDFIGLAQTGTGKTAAFGLPLLHHIDINNKATQAVILAPTRELGRQIAEQIEFFSKYTKGLKSVAVYGGANISTQIKALKKNQHIIIATPGRLIDLIKRKVAKLNQIQFLILDEADEMLNMGFKEEIDKILQHTPDDKKTWLFSATMPKGIRRIVSEYMQGPLEVKLNTQNEVNKDILHQYALVKGTQKREALMRFIDQQEDMRGVVFCRTKLGTQNLAEALIKQGYLADALHGDMSQAQRDRVMKRFKTHALKILIATDVAARGIDVNDLTHVFHFQLPDDLSYYTHRSGRTARAGKKGISIAFINGREKARIERIANSLKINFERAMIPDVADIATSRIDNWCRQILEKKSRKKLDPALLEQAILLFGNLSKEELIAKLLTAELEKLNLINGSDLNDNEPTKKAYKQRSKGRSGKAKSHRGRPNFKSKNDRKSDRKSGRRKKRS